MRPRTRSLPARALPLIALAVAAIGCGTSADCRPTFEYNIDIDVSTAPRASCQVEFRKGTTVASYAFQSLPPPSLGDPCFQQRSQPQCTAASGSPQPTSCEASVCWIHFTFKEDVARQLSTLLGAEILEMLTTCGGQVVSSGTVRPIKQVCYL